MANKIVITVNKKIYEIPMPPNTTLREQNPECNRNQRLCMTMQGNLTCAKLLLKEDKQGNFEFFSLEPCQKSKSNKIMELKI